MPIAKDILAYNAAQSPADKRICTTLAKAIDRHLPADRRPARKEGRPSPPSPPRSPRTPTIPDTDREAKIWHRHPVWFLAGNPIVGYSKLIPTVPSRPHLSQ